MRKTQQTSNINSDWTYIAVLETCYHADIGKYQTYGIEGTCNRSNYSITLHDVCVYEDMAVFMADLFNKHNLSPIHLQDAVENLLD